MDNSLREPALTSSQAFHAPSIIDSPPLPKPSIFSSQGKFSLGNYVLSEGNKPHLSHACLVSTVYFVRCLYTLTYNIFHLHRVGMRHR